MLFICLYTCEEMCEIKYCSGKRCPQDTFDTPGLTILSTNNVDCPLSSTVLAIALLFYLFLVNP